VSGRPAPAADRRSLAARLKRRVAGDPLLRELRRLAAAHEVPLWLVGGAVRDAALGAPVKDFDLSVGRPARRLIAAIGQRWGTRPFRVRKRGVTTWRLHVEGRALDLVDASGRGIEGDLRRRELTLNAVAFDVVRDEVLDPLAGLVDLRAGRLRPTRPDVMREDPLRALRLARFAAQLPGFRVHPDALRQAREIAPRLRRAAAERIGEELQRLLVSVDPVRGLELVERTGLLPEILPELAPLSGCVAGKNRPDVWRHTLDALDRSTRAGRLPGGATVGRDPLDTAVLRWSLLLHDVSKPETLAIASDGRPTFHGHEELGARRADALLRRLRRPADLRRRVRKLVRLHLRPGHLADSGAPERGLRRLVRHAGDDLPALLVHAACDALASGTPNPRPRWRRMRAVLLRLGRIHRGPLGRPLPKLVGGGDVIERLGLEPGPRIGAILGEIEELQIAGEIADREAALRYLDGLA